MGKVGGLSKLPLGLVMLNHERRNILENLVVKKVEPASQPALSVTLASLYSNTLGKVDFIGHFSRFYAVYKNSQV